MSFVITARCENGHEQKISFYDFSREWVEEQAGLLDGTSPRFQVSPIGTDSVIGKCGICRAQIKCTVDEQLPEGSKFYGGGADRPSGILRMDPNTEPDPALSKPIHTGTKAIEPVDRTARVLASGKLESEVPDYREIQENGQQKEYVVLSDAERAKGFVRLVRHSYIHAGKLQEFENPDHPSGVTQKWTQRVGGCGSKTTMGQKLAETYARDPKFYTHTFCTRCREHFPVEEFVWESTDLQVGS